MREARTITCEDCGAPYETSRANTKRCSLCRLLQDFQFIGLRTTLCWVCDTRIAPLDRRDRTCGECMYITRKYGTINCGICKEDKPAVCRDVAICNDCARLPGERAGLMRALKRKQAARREQFALVEA